MNTRYQHKLPIFGNVALADILANSVAIIIIMIVISLSIHNQQETKRLEEVENVSVLLSRELASSLVMSSLPTSPPAVLHNYHESPIDRHPHHDIMPVIELHKSFIRDFYTGRTYDRKALLLQDNAFDKYLQSLSLKQLYAMRVDIYSVTEFYIFMSILKQHNHSPLHWHFIGYSVAQDGGSSGLEWLANSPGAKNNIRHPSVDADAAKKFDIGFGLQNSLPEDISLTPPLGDNKYPFDNRFSNSPFAENPQNNPQLWGDNQTQKNNNKQSKNGQKAINKDSLLFRSASPVFKHPQSDSFITQNIDLYTILRILFRYMENVQKDVDNNLPSALPSFNFYQEILELLPQLPEFEDLDKVFLFRTLEDEFNLTNKPSDATIPVAVATTDSIKGQTFAVAVNKRIDTLQWLRDKSQPQFKEPPKQISMSLRLNQHAEIYTGIRIPLTTGVTILSPLAELQNMEFKWRIVTIVDAAAQDYVSGFLYAAVDANEQLLLPVDENAISVGGLRVESFFEVEPHKREFLQIIFFSIIILVFSIGIFIRHRAQ